MTIAKKRLILAPAARADLKGIRRFIAQDNPAAARAFLADLTAKIAWIAQVDFTGSPRDHVSPGLRLFPYRQRCIYYRSFADRIVVLRVMHEAEDVSRQSFESHPR